MTELSVRAVSLGWREPFVWRRLAVGLMFSVLPIAVCLTFRAGLLALLAIAIGSYPWPIRMSVDARGLTLRWAFVRQTLLAEQLVRVSLMTDVRRWAWPRRKVLVLERHGKRQVLVFAREAVLAQLAQMLAPRAAPAVVEE